MRRRRAVARPLRIGESSTTRGSTCWPLGPFWPSSVHIGVCRQIKQTNKQTVIFLYRNCHEKKIVCACQYMTSMPNISSRVYFYVLIATVYWEFVNFVWKISKVSWTKYLFGIFDVQQCFPVFFFVAISINEPYLLIIPVQTQIHNLSNWMPSYDLKIEGFLSQSQFRLLFAVSCLSPLMVIDLSVWATFELG